MVLNFPTCKMGKRYLRWHVCGDLQNEDNQHGTQVAPAVPSTYRYTPVLPRGKLETSCVLDEHSSN